MPASFRRKLLKRFGLGNPESPESTAPAVPNDHASGGAFVNDDERILSEDRSNGTYVRLARLSDGSILAGFTWRHDNLRVLRISKSVDGGESFFDFAEVTRGVKDIDNMHILEVAPNTVLAAFRNHDLGPSGFADYPNDLQYYRLTVCQSVDGGQTWTFLSQVAEKSPSSPPLGIWEPFMRIGQEGEVQCIFSQEFAPDDQRTMLAKSYDQGRTWSTPRVIEGGRNRFRDGMTGITETIDNGRAALVMVFETTRYGPFNVEGVISYDDGDTWHHRHEIFVPPPGRNAGAPQIASFADGSLACVFMTDDQAERVDWVRNAAIRAVFADPPQNGKIHWGRPTLVSPASSFWPGILSLDHRRVLVTYEHEGPRARTINWQPR
jgi:hypothetical protein